MTIIGGIRDYISSCPLLATGRVCIDWLGAEPMDYSVDGIPVQPIIKKYADGGTIRQFNFVFSSVENYGGDGEANAENNGFYQEFADWIEEQNHIGNLPEIGEKLIPISVEALTTGTLYESTAKQARYQIQLRLLYYKD